MSLEEMSSFDVYKPIYLEHYNRKQRDWIDREMYLIANRPGHKTDFSHDELQRELIEDMEENHNPLRFKVFYALKYPGFVKRIE
jgi:hypothetical protein